ncbi:hypothetical protein WJX72_008643 [[Myrmecia] bisecta]|uniref:ABC transporter domain-containing protein n=1 Tax=[Myrmecia] bisecta TaxID=41462 RepID=A0AAW1PAY1_9CHLO
MVDVMDTSPKPSTGLPIGTVQGWPKRFWQQFTALLLFKTVRVALRNRRSTIVRLALAPLIFIFLVFVIDKAIRASDRRSSDFQDVRSPATEPITPIPSCDTDLYVRQPCWDFFYTPDTPDTQAIVAAIKANNPGRVIPDAQVKGFADRAASNAFMSADPEKVIGAVHFAVISPTNIGFTLQTNSTTKFFKSTFQNRELFVQLPLQVAVERELSRRFFAAEGKTLDASAWSVAIRKFPHPVLTTGSVVGQVIGPFLFAANMFAFVLVISGVVGERELGLRQALRTMGMLDSSFWSSWFAFEVVMAAITSLLIGAFGAIFQFDIFLKNSFGLLFFLFFLFQLAMAAFAFFLSTFISKASVAVNLGFGIFIVGWIMQVVLLFGYPFTPSYVGDIPIVTVIFGLVPWSYLVKGVNDLGSASAEGQPGIRWGDRYEYCKNLSSDEIAKQPYLANTYRDFQCVLSLGQAYGLLIGLTIVYTVLALFLDNVLPNENGVRRAPWYFLMPNYWCNVGRANFRKRPTVQTAAGAQTVRPSLRRTSTLDNAAVPQDEDVANEEKRVKELLAHRSGTSGAMSELEQANAVEVFGLQKVFGRNIFKRKSSEFWAIKGSWFAIEKNQLFCLLGPNGAGKTTTINCLTGVLPPSGGDALVYGQSLSSSGGMDRIRSIMGVCPQFDILWGELTGREHMLIYGNIKGLDPKLVRAQSETLLAKVKLSEAGNMRTSSYSGGMKRRLSVAIALLGDPHIVYLDEPTTGMDPISRRHVWDIIEDAKQGRAIVLTTHSMEEADVLGDRIAIMAKGRLRCIGSSIRLKQRFGSGYQVAVSVLPSGRSQVDLVGLEKRSQQVQAFFRNQLGLEPSDETKAYIQYLVPRSKEAALPAVLSMLEADAGEMGISDIQLSLTSLEEVFLTIARKAELEAAAAEGRATSIIYLDDGHQLKVPIGEETATHPVNGSIYRIKWAQDDAGRLQILEWHLQDSLSSVTATAAS